MLCVGITLTVGTLIRLHTLKAGLPLGRVRGEFVCVGGGKKQIPVML